MHSFSHRILQCQATIFLIIPPACAQEAAGAGAGVEEDPTMAAFKRAAAELAEKRREESMAVEDRIAKHLKKWVKDWEEDLEKRPEEVKRTPTGEEGGCIKMHG